MLQWQREPGELAAAGSTVKPLVHQPRTPHVSCETTTKNPYAEASFDNLSLSDSDQLSIDHFCQPLCRAVLRERCDHGRARSCSGMRDAGEPHIRAPNSAPRDAAAAFVDYLYCDRLAVDPSNPQARPDIVLLKLWGKVSIAFGSCKGTSSVALTRCWGGQAAAKRVAGEPAFEALKGLNRYALGMHETWDTVHVILHLAKTPGVFPCAGAGGRAALGHLLWGAAADCARGGGPRRHAAGAAVARLW